MSVDYLSQPNDTYEEDVATAGNGTVLVSRPCQVWKISVKMDTGTSAIVSFANNSARYTAATRKDKAVLSTGQTTCELSYPHGLNCTSGLSCISNVAGVDVFVSFD